MSGNRGVVYLGAGKVEVQKIDYPKMQDPRGKKIEHGVILKVVSTNICGSDQHMVRGRTTAQTGLVLGHEITGEVIEKGSDVENLKIGDLVSVPFNVACVAVAAAARSNTPASACRSTPHVLAVPTVTSTWVTGPEARPNTPWCLTLTSTC